MLKSIELSDLIKNIDIESNVVKKTNMPLIINYNGKPSLVLLNYKGYKAIETIFDMIDLTNLKKT